MSIKKIDISDIRGFRLGNAEDKIKGTGCTVIVCEKGAVGGVDVRGGAPATRETDLLRSENSVNSVNAVVLSGGSAYGLEAGSGVMRELSKRGVGLKAGDAIVPIVCGASLFDLSVGDPKVFPDVKMGQTATVNAFRGGFKNGNRGAGTGASVGKIMGNKRAMKTGLGSFACGDEFLQVGAIACVNAVGDIYNGAGNIIAGLRSEDGESISGTIRALKGMVYESVPDEEENGKTEKAASVSLPSKPAKSENTEHTRDYSNIIQAIEAEIRRTSAIEAKEIEERISRSKNAAEDEKRKASKSEAPEDLYLTMFDEAPARAEPAAKAAPKEPEQPAPRTAASEQSMIPEAAAETKAPENRQDAPGSDQSGDGDELGYDIPFNTTISCLITNAKLTKSQANKLATILHDAYARAIKPVHSTLDGDTIFVLSTCSQEVNFDAFAALATDVLQYAIIDSAISAKGAYGLPAAADIKR